MANLTPTAGWDDVVQLETTTLALAGPGAIMNAQAQALLNRTEDLDDRVTVIEALPGGTTVIDGGHADSTYGAIGPIEGGGA